ncbi:subunit Rpb8 of RNA polymerase [Ordospora colligata]|uniref:Subunit Rpb8 of RNA polymerase n=1 Tax=Ordospora colligata OC4 TaxID=1354746 RepID=A0A0B2UE46_9MICR|nr:subunit Rpb8 of RNA polymerase [Ordospora colligata OC4]KHN69346.1 subunit Rpb8 of RNA polymerase [Ordospora colligata OC4]TBU14860.1 subunit Rpb8 of RNA polymerase [Ordospora colligata]TBU14991.1 subunit Rpb8 of RNA polymerase [Ordospora colligata]TBU18245.1 subunit Rpb8 of RNA polymerase [Ordospora colligata]
MQILVDTFRLSAIDKDGKLYSNVSRAHMESTDSSLVLDYNSVLCKLESGHTVEIRILKGFNDNIECHYLMHGKVYCVDNKGSRTILKASFGGLLLIIDSPREKINSIRDKDEITLALTFM